MAYQKINEDDFFAQSKGVGDEPYFGWSKLNSAQQEIERLEGLASEHHLLKLRYEDLSLAYLLDNLWCEHPWDEKESQEVKEERAKATARRLEIQFELDKLNNI